MINKEHLGVKLEVLQFVIFDAHILHGAKTADALGKFFLGKLVRRASHDVNFHAAHLGADQAFDDDCVLIAFVLGKDGMFRGVNGAGDAFTAVAGAPDEVSIFAGVEWLALPVRFETINDLPYFSLMG